MYVLPNVNLRHPVRMLIANAGPGPVMPSLRIFFTSGREALPDQYQLAPAPGSVPPSGTWLSTLTFLEVGVGSEPIDGQVQITFEGDETNVAVQYEYDQIIRRTVRINAMRV